MTVLLHNDYKGLVLRLHTDINAIDNRFMYCTATITILGTVEHYEF